MLLEPTVQQLQEDVDTREAVAYQLEKSGMMGSMSELTSVGKAAFLATTGPGFFTRGVLRGLQHVGSQEVLAKALVFPPEVFYPLCNSQRELGHEERSSSATSASLAIHHWFRTWAADEGGLTSTREDPVAKET
ncbi:unnamed protein product [Polarella glacialis]|uniref:Uncharacterized protein n=1 Tax=Polarella glacialis TaxID=89957 RepID=A0A813ET95_POLGL|nr:unnamed protein product [Polarella glacialis]